MASPLSTNEVTVLYNDVLLRSPDAGGLASWASAIDAGSTVAQVTNDFVASTEAQTIVDPIVRLYEGLLGRTPDSAGLASWVAQADNGASAQTLAQGFVQSAEFAQDYGAPATIDPTTFVNSLYSNVLGRPADAAGLAYWVGVLGTTPTAASLATVVLGFVNSAEYIADTQSGIDTWLTNAANSAEAATTASALGTATYSALPDPSASFTFSGGATDIVNDATSGAVNLSNITAPGSSLELVNTAGGALDLTGTTFNPATPWTVVDNGSAVTFGATDVSGNTIAFSGGATDIVNDATSGAVNLSNITASGSSLELVNTAGGALDLTGTTFNPATPWTVVDNGSAVTFGAADVSGDTIAFNSSTNGSSESIVGAPTTSPAGGYNFTNVTDANPANLSLSLTTASSTAGINFGTVTGVSNFGGGVTLTGSTWQPLTATLNAATGVNVTIATSGAMSADNVTFGAHSSAVNITYTGDLVTGDSFSGLAANDQITLSVAQTSSGATAATLAASAAAVQGAGEYYFSGGTLTYWDDNGGSDGNTGNTSAGAEATAESIALVGVNSVSATVANHHLVFQVTG